jgi:hypothetical protein
VPNAVTLLEHIVASHTTAEDVGRVAKAAGVKTLVLSHFVPCAGYFAGPRRCAGLPLVQPRDAGGRVE